MGNKQKLQRRWQKITDLLRDVYSTCKVENKNFKEYLRHNELELALLELIDCWHKAHYSKAQNKQDVWAKIQKAHDLMKLEED